MYSDVGFITRAEWEMTSTCWCWKEDLCLPLNVHCTLSELKLFAPIPYETNLNTIDQIRYGSYHFGSKVATNWRHLWYCRILVRHLTKCWAHSLLIWHHIISIMLKLFRGMVIVMCSNWRLLAMNRKLLYFSCISDSSFPFTLRRG